MSDRPTWVDTWMEMAERLALRSLCDGRQIGAFIVSSDNGYCVVGYNGPPRGLSTPRDDRTRRPASCSSWCPRMLSDERTASYDNCVSVHAEANAIAKADRSMIEGGSMYVTSACCWDCGKLVANSGIATVYMHMDPITDAHRNPMRTIRFMRECGLGVFVI